MTITFNENLQRAYARGHFLGSKEVKRLIDWSNAEGDGHPEKFKCPDPTEQWIGPADDLQGLLPRFKNEPAYWELHSEVLNAFIEGFETAWRDAIKEYE